MVVREEQGRHVPGAESSTLNLGDHPAARIEIEQVAVHLHRHGGARAVGPRHRAAAAEQDQLHAVPRLLCHRQLIERSINQIIDDLPVRAQDFISSPMTRSHGALHLTAPH